MGSGEWGCGVRLNDIFVILVPFLLLLNPYSPDEVAGHSPWGADDCWGLLAWSQSSL